MDKQTLSNYGWIVICVLVLSVMIALATPFGNYIKNAVWSTTEGFFETEDAALGKVLDDMGIVPTTDQLQNKYKFEYYSTLSGAVADVNANTIGESADCEKADATAGIYTNNGETFVVLLKDTTETSRVTVSADMTINLGGNVLTFDNTIVGIDTVDDNGNTINIDGRLKGSKIYSFGQGKNVRCIQCRTGNTINVNGGTYVSESDSGKAYGIHFSESSTGTVSNCTVSSTSQSNTVYGICFNTSSTGTVSNCTVSSTSQSNTVYGIYFNDSSTGTVSNCTISAYSNYLSDGRTYISNSIGIVCDKDTNIDIKNCNVRGVHSGIESSGNITIDGGTYEGFGHGGFYFSGDGSGNEVWIANATIKECAMPDGFTNTVDGVTTNPNHAGFYIGGKSSANNITVYMDNCNIYGEWQPIVLRGTEGEQNNSLYISNSNINTSAKIRIDNDTHKLYIGKGNNFTANNTNRTSAVITTDEIYCQ